MNEEITMTPEENEEFGIEVEEKSGIGTGFAMIVGGVLAVAGIAGVKKLKEMWKNRKSKKEIIVDETVESEDFRVVDNSTEVE